MLLIVSLLIYVRIRNNVGCGGKGVLSEGGWVLIKFFMMDRIFMGSGKGYYFGGG